MATAMLIFNMGWFNGLQDGEFLEVISRARTIPYLESGPLRKEFDAFHPMLSVIPDEAVAFAEYRGRRQNFMRKECPPPGSANGVTAWFTPITNGAQSWIVMGAPHSQVRADFIAVWHEKRAPRDVGKPFYSPQAAVLYKPGLSLKEQMAASERAILLGALQAHAWIRNKTADALGINRTTLHTKMRKHGLDDVRVAG